MDNTLHLLVVEDSEDDLLLLLRELKKSGFDNLVHKRVDDEESLRSALKDECWDIVITDHIIPGFSSDETIAITKESDESMPVIIVSGSIGEDIAVAAMKSGANDYIMKGNLQRLGPAIERELRDAKIRREHKNAQKTIEHMAFHDSLTGLANRSRFERQIQYALDNTSFDRMHTLLYIDLDQFKIINDTCGHAAGDEMLSQVGALLSHSLRHGDTLARLGGDEFGVLLQDCTLEDAKRIGENLLHQIRDFRFTWKGKSFVIGASVGLVMLDHSGQTLSEVMGQADMACYAAKDKGRNRLEVYRRDNKELKRLHSEMEWVNKIHHALANDLLEVHFQKIISLQSESPCICYEFLVRMSAEDGSESVPPGNFIPAAERYGMMPAIDKWVINHCFEYLANTSIKQDPSLPKIAFINISGTTLSDESLLTYIQDHLKKYHLSGSMICFEITETAAIANLSQALKFINSVKQLGCYVALDDFGTGLSSFSYLKTMKADFLKIDGSFIEHLLDDPMDAAIVESIKNIAHIAGIKTIAEFVESEAIINELKKIGIDLCQGYHIHRPEPLVDGRIEEISCRKIN